MIRENTLVILAEKFEWDDYFGAYSTLSDLQLENAPEEFIVYDEFCEKDVVLTKNRKYKNENFIVHEYAGYYDSEKMIVKIYE
jgi:hypothetical protein